MAVLLGFAITWFFVMVVGIGFLAFWVFDGFTDFGTAAGFRRTLVAVVSSTFLIAVFGSVIEVMDKPQCYKSVSVLVYDSETLTTSYKTFFKKEDCE